MLNVESGRDCYIVVSPLFTMSAAKAARMPYLYSRDKNLGFVSEGRFLWDFLLPATLFPSIKYILPLFVHVQA